MKVMKIKPDGWPCKISEYSGGHFVFDGQLCFKTEYADDDGYSEVYNSAGEFFWPDESKDQREEIEIQPVYVVWEKA